MVILSQNLIFFAPHSLNYHNSATFTTYY